MKPNLKIVVALGGNAISRQEETGDIPDQIKNCHRTAEHLVDLVAAGHKVIVTHGNGPQVGNILRRVEAARRRSQPGGHRLSLAARDQQCLQEPRYG